MSGNPWICDCTTIAFVEFQDHNEWFKYQYDSRTGIVDLGTCQYPRALRNDIENMETRFSVYMIVKTRSKDHNFMSS